MTKTILERAKEKHNALVKEHAKINDDLDRLDDKRMRKLARKTKVIRALARSSKRMRLLEAAATHTNGPTASVAPNLVSAVADKPAKQDVLNDPAPEFKPTKRKRRTPDDFKADLQRRKLDPEGPLN